MKGWGRVSCLVLLGLSLALACGGRTDAFDDYYVDEGTAGSSIGAGASSATAGKPGKGGSAAGGTKAVGGKGSGGKPSSAGAPSAGAFPIAGFTAGGSSGVGGVGFSGAGGTVMLPPIGGFAGAGGVPAGCQQCLFESCSSEFLQCLQDVGCLAIIFCAQNSGCQGLDCYTNGTCKGVIDNYGGPAGSSMNNLLQTFGCAVNAGCSCN